MAKKPKTPKMKIPNLAPGTATTTSKVSNVSNSGQMSTQTSSTGATGAVKNTTTIYQGGDPGFTSGQESQLITNYRKMLGL